LTVGRLPSRMTLRAFLRGVKVKATPDERSALAFALEAAARRAVVARSYNLTLARKSFPLATSTRSARLKPSRGLIGRARRFKIRVAITATDAIGNRTIVRKSITIRR